MKKQEKELTQKQWREFCATKGDKCHQMWKEICNTNNPNDLKLRIKNKDCYNYFWKHSIPGTDGITNDFFNKWKSVVSTVKIPVKDILDNEQEKYCFKTIN